MSKEKTKTTDEKPERAWFIEINPNAECYPLNKEEEFIKGIKATNPTFWAYILHDEDLNEDGTEKLKHFHLFIHFQNPRTFNGVQSLFNGAHIEKATSEASCVRYLVHLDNPEKRAYLDSDIITNDLERVRYHLSKPQYQTFIANDLLDYFNLWGLRTFWDFVYVFGVDQVQKYRGAIEALSREQDRQCRGTKSKPVIKT